MHEWTIDPDRTAFVTVDLQRAFLEPGSPTECAAARAFVPKVNSLASLCRMVDVPVIHVYQCARPDLKDLGLIREVRPRTDSHLEATEGLPGVEFHKDLVVDETDYRVKKIRYSAFVPGSSSLEPLLRGLSRDTLLLSGVATDVCVGTTAMDAMMLGFRVFLLSDLTATLTEDRQRVALEVYEKHFARVVKASLVEEELRDRAGLATTVRS